MKKVLDMTLQEVIDSGANVEILYHHLESEEDAKHKVSPFESLGDIDTKVFDDETARVRVGKFSDGITVGAFYTPPQEYEPEEARARMTEYERGLRDSGHKQSDFL